MINANARISNSVNYIFLDTEPNCFLEKNVIKTQIKLRMTKVNLIKIYGKM